MLGTPDFIAPEQIDDAQGADIRADIYSLGCTMYFLLSGRPPFQAETLYDMLQAHHSMDARLLNFVRPEVPAELAAMVVKMMAKEPRRRFQTPSEVAKALVPFFKKPTAASVSPRLEMTPVVAPDVSRAATEPTQSGPDAIAAPPPAPAPEAKAEGVIWESLIDFKETEEDTEAVANEAKPARERPRWLWPAVAAGVMLVGLIAVWATVVLKMKTANGWLVFENLPEQADVLVDGENVTVHLQRRRSGYEFSVTAGKRTVLVKQDGLELAGEDVSVEAGKRIPIHVWVEPPPNGGPRPPLSKPTRSAPEIREIASIKTADRVIQARLLPDVRHVLILYETEGKNRALWSGDLTDPKKPIMRKLEAKAPSDWVQLVLSSDGRFAVLAGKDKTLWRWDIQTGQSRLLRSENAGLTALALSPDGGRRVLRLR